MRKILSAVCVKCYRWFWLQIFGKVAQYKACCNQSLSLNVLVRGVLINVSYFTDYNQSFIFKVLAPNSERTQCSADIKNGEIALSESFGAHKSLCAECAVC